MTKSLPKVAFHQAQYVLRLYINGTALKSSRAVDTVKRLCKEHLKGRYDLTVIDIFRHADLARREQIVAVPTLIRRLPLPKHILVGDMSDIDMVLAGLGLKVRES